MDGAKKACAWELWIVWVGVGWVLVGWVDRSSGGINPILWLKPAGIIITRTCGGSVVLPGAAPRRGGGTGGRRRAGRPLSVLLLMVPWLLAASIGRRGSDPLLLRVMRACAIVIEVPRCLAVGCD